MRNIFLAAAIVISTSVVAYSAPRGEEPSHHAFTGKTDNPHWVPGYGDNRTCHGACLTAPFWNKLFGFVQYMHKHGI